MSEYNNGRIEMLKYFQHSLINVAWDAERLKKRLNELYEWAYNLEANIKNAESMVRHSKDIDIERRRAETQ